MHFAAGQFAWLSLEPSALALQQNPFSFSSSAERRDRVELTIKELGDFTSTIGSVRPGTAAFIEGPYGALVIPDNASGAVFIAGGVGITPIMSMLRTLSDRGDTRPLALIYATSGPERTLFLDELPTLRTRLQLEIVHVFENPGQEPCERGMLTADILERRIPVDRPDLHYFICGPSPMMDLAEQVLALRDISMDRIHVERFDIA
jgi:predicted ferric reductase